MFITMKPDMFEINDIYYCKSIKNKIMTGGTFTRIIYSNELVSMNGVHLIFTLNGRTQEIYNNKFKFICDTDEKTRSIIQLLQLIEHDILKERYFKNKQINYKLKEQFHSGFFKFFQSKSHVKTTNDTHSKAVLFSLKISGIWSTDDNYGITYKFTRL
jgi:hypothetical protein